MTPILKSIDHIHVYVVNRGIATNWYHKVLGMKPITDLEFWANDGGPLTISDSSGSVHLALFESKKEKCRSTIAFGVGAKEFLAWQIHLGETFKQEVKAVDHAVAWSLYFTDPDGNPFEITSYDHESLAKSLRTEA